MIASVSSLAIYLDHHATTPLDPRVLDAMMPYLQGKFGNASSRSHRFGWEAEEAVEGARGRVARLLGADPREIVFTSGATESNNLAMRGLAELGRSSGNRILISPVEHPSVTDTALHLATRGFVVGRLGVDALGRVEVPAPAEGTILVSVMLANNEVGTIQPVHAIAAASRGAWFHTDATQGVGKIAFDVKASPIHTASLTGHKMGGPKGCGALYVRKGVELAPLLFGGGQERGMRPGTLNVPAIVGLGMACDICRREREAEAARVGRLRDLLLTLLRAGLDRVHPNGDPDPTGRLPGNLHLSFDGVESQDLILSLPDIAFSTGAACASGALEPSPVLMAMGIPPRRARSAVRFGLGRTTTEQEIRDAAGQVVGAVNRLRAKGASGRRSG